MFWKPVLFLLVIICHSESVKIGISKTTPAQQPSFLAPLPTIMPVEGNATNATTETVTSPKLLKLDTVSEPTFTTSLMTSKMTPGNSTIANVTTTTAKSLQAAVTTIAPTTTLVPEDQEKKKRKKKRRRGNHAQPAAYYCPCDLKVGSCTA